MDMHLNSVMGWKLWGHNHEGLLGDSSSMEFLIINPILGHVYHVLHVPMNSSHHSKRILSSHTVDDFRVSNACSTHDWHILYETINSPVLFSLGMNHIPFGTDVAGRNNNKFCSECYLEIGMSTIRLKLPKAKILPGMAAWDV